MQQPVQITFKEMEHSDAVEARVREQVDKLERFHEDITSCHVVIEAGDRHSHHGGLYEVKLDIQVPGDEIVVSHQGPKDQGHEDVYVAIRDAFRAARRQLQESLDKRRGRVKRHESE